jgi:hypothetical protein
MIEGKDGKDIMEWVGKHEWSKRNVGKLGTSCSAKIQWLTAVEKPDGLKAMVSIVSPSDQFVESPTEVYDPMHVSLRYLVSGRTLKNTDDIDWYSVNSTLPIRDIPRALSMKLPDWEGGYFIRHYFPSEIGQNTRKSSRKSIYPHFMGRAGTMKDSLDVRKSHRNEK